MSFEVSKKKQQKCDKSELLWCTNHDLILQNSLPTLYVCGLFVYIVCEKNPSDYDKFFHENGIKSVINGWNQIGITSYM